MLDNTVKREVKEETDNVAIQSLADLTGFPVEMIQSELFAGKDKVDSVQLKDLRAAMMSYIDKTMLESEEQ